MVTLPFLSTIRTVTYTATVALFLFVVAVFLLYLIYQVGRGLIIRIRSLAKRKMLDRLFGYMLAELDLEQVSFRASQHTLIIEGFATIISSIKGQKQQRMKAAVNALGLVSILQRWLQTPAPARRMRACHLLGLIGSKASSSSLETALFDSNPRVISAAIIALGEITNSDTVPRLARFFLDCRYPHAWLVTAILPIFGSQVYGEIKEALLSEELPDEKKALLLTIIANIKPQESFRDLKMLYQTTNDLDLKVRTLRAIGNLNDLSSVKMVFDALKSPEWQIRAVSCSIIGDMSLKGAAFRLIPLLRDENWYVRRNAAGALMGLGRLGIMTLVSYLEIDDVYARDVIVQTLEERGLVDQAMRDTRSRDEGRSKEGRQLLRALVQKGYTKYLRNFTKSDPVVRELLEGGENV